MTKMTKYQLDHFKSKVKRQFNPMIEEQELLVKRFKTEATDKAVGKLSKKMGADKILARFRVAEQMLKEARDSARTFFNKKVKNEDNRTLTYNVRNRDERLSLEDCEEQLREWASDLAQREIERRPEGAKLKHLKDLKLKAIDTVMEAGTPETLIISLNLVSQKIGLNWNQELKALPSVN
tara:strand:+ start:103 stop:642 length:540 start_codon:yes stop_codon:yes gene_type:complete